MGERDEGVNQSFTVGENIFILRSSGMVDVYNNDLEFLKSFKLSDDPINTAYKGQGESVYINDLYLGNNGLLYVDFGTVFYQDTEVYGGVHVYNPETGQLLRKFERKQFEKWENRLGIASFTTR